MSLVIVERQLLWLLHYLSINKFNIILLTLYKVNINFQPNSQTYESVTVFCPSERTELVDLLTSEDKLLDLTQPLYLNFTHEAIVKRFERRYEAHDKITGDVYVCENPPKEADTDGYVKRFL